MVVVLKFSIFKESEIIKQTFWMSLVSTLREENFTNDQNDFFL